MATARESDMMAADDDWDVTNQRRRFVAEQLSVNKMWRPIRFKSPIRHCLRVGVPFQLEHADGRIDTGEAGSYLVIDETGAVGRLGEDLFAEQYEEADVSDSMRADALKQVGIAARGLRMAFGIIKGIPVAADPEPLPPEGVPPPPGAIMETKLATHQDIEDALKGKRVINQAEAEQLLSTHFGIPVSMLQKAVEFVEHAKSLSTEGTPQPPTEKPVAKPMTEKRVKPKAVEPDKTAQAEPNPMGSISPNDPVVTGEMPVEPHPAELPLPSLGDDDDDEEGDTPGSSPDDEDEDEADVDQLFGPDDSAGSSGGG